jgi:hypothetical protein
MVRLSSTATTLARVAPCRKAWTRVEGGESMRTKVGVSGGTWTLN